MIIHDQPTLFPNNLTVRVSSIEDGTMTVQSLPDDPEQVWQNRQEFIERVGGDIAKTALVFISYNGREDFCRYHQPEADDFRFDSSRPADALVTQAEGVGLFLPIADCCATVIFDPITKTLMLSHNGRHSTEQFGGKRAVEHLIAEYGVDPKDLLVWLSPTVGVENYPVHARNDEALNRLIMKDLEAAGVDLRSIEVSPVDTATDDNYFSHSEFQKGTRGDVDGRFAVFVVIA